MNICLMMTTCTGKRSYMCGIFGNKLKKVTHMVFFSKKECCVDIFVTRSKN